MFCGSTHLKAPSLACRQFRAAEAAFKRPEEPEPWGDATRMGRWLP